MWLILALLFIPNVIFAGGLSAEPLEISEDMRNGPQELIEHPQALTLYALNRLNEIFNGQRPKTVAEMSYVVSALNRAIRLIDSGAEMRLPSPLPSMLAKGDAYMARALCYATLDWKVATIADLLIAKQLGTAFFDESTVKKWSKAVEPAIPSASNNKQEQLRVLKEHLKHKEYYSAIRAFEEPIPVEDGDQNSGLFDLNPYEESQWYLSGGNAYGALQLFERGIRTYDIGIEKRPDSSDLRKARKEAVLLKEQYDSEQERLAAEKRKRDKEQLHATLWRVGIVFASLTGVGLLYAARRPLINAPFALVRVMRARRQARRERAQTRNAEIVPVNSPVHPPSYAPPYHHPQSFDWRYPNTAYRYASYCSGAFWVLLCIPVVILAAIPAWTVLMNFSAYGLARAIANAKNFAFSFPQWGRPWFATLLIIGTGFIGLKIYGRYTLPKPMRPKVRVLHAVKWLALGTAFVGVGTVALIVISSVAGGVVEHLRWICSWAPFC